MTYISSRFKKDIYTKDTHLIPFLVFGEYDPENRLNNTVIAPTEIRLDTRHQDGQPIFAEALLLSIPGIKEKIDFEKRNFTINTLTVKLSNFKVGYDRFSDRIGNEIYEGQNVTLFWKSQHTYEYKLIDDDRPDDDYDCYRAFVGKLYKIEHSADTVTLTLEDQTQSIFNKILPQANAKDEQPIPMVYGEVDHSPGVYDENDNYTLHFDTRELGSWYVRNNRLAHTYSAIYSPYDEAYKENDVFSDYNSSFKNYPLHTMQDGHFVEVVSEIETQIQDSDFSGSNWNTGVDGQDEQPYGLEKQYIIQDSKTVKLQPCRLINRGGLQIVVYWFPKFGVFRPAPFWDSVTGNVSGINHQDADNNILDDETTWKQFTDDDPFGGVSYTNELSWRVEGTGNSGFGMSTNIRIGSFWFEMSLPITANSTPYDGFDNPNENAYPPLRRAVSLNGYVLPTGTQNFGDTYFIHDTEGNNGANNMIVGPDMTAVDYSDLFNIVTDAGLGNLQGDFTWRAFTDGMGNTPSDTPVDYSMWFRNKREYYTMYLYATNPYNDPDNNALLFAVGVNWIKARFKQVKCASIVDINKPLERKYFGSKLGRLHAGQVMYEPSIIIRDILNNELDYYNIDNEDYLESNSIHSDATLPGHYGSQLSFTIDEHISSKKLIEGIAKSSRIFPSFDTDNNFKFNSIKPHYTLSDWGEAEEIKSYEVIDFKISRTPKEQVYTNYKVLYKKNYSTGDYDGSTGDIYLSSEAAAKHGYKLNIDTNNDGIPDSSNENPFVLESDYIRKGSLFTDAFSTQRFLYEWYRSQHLKIILTLPLKYLTLSVGMVVKIDELISGVKAYGKDYTKPYEVINARESGGQNFHEEERQFIYPLFKVMQMEKKVDGIKIELIQLHSTYFVQTEDVLWNTDAQADAPQKQLIDYMWPESNNNTDFANIQWQADIPYKVAPHKFYTVYNDAFEIFDSVNETFGVENPELDIVETWQVSGKASEAMDFSMGFAEFTPLRLFANQRDPAEGTDEGDWNVIRWQKSFNAFLRIFGNGGPNYTINGVPTPSGEYASSNFPVWPTLDAVVDEDVLVQTQQSQVAAKIVSIKFPTEFEICYWVKRAEFNESVSGWWGAIAEGYINAPPIDARISYHPCMADINDNINLWLAELGALAYTRAAVEIRFFNLQQGTQIHFNGDKMREMCDGFYRLNPATGELLDPEEWVPETVGDPTGDINGDGVLNVLDIVGIVAYIMGTNEFDEDQQYNADLNQDGIINVLDIVALVNKVLNSGD